MSTTTHTLDMICAKRSTKTRSKRKLRRNSAKTTPKRRQAGWRG